MSKRDFQDAADRKEDENEKEDQVAVVEASQARNVDDLVRQGVKRASFEHIIALSKGLRA